MGLDSDPGNLLPFTSTLVPNHVISRLAYDSLVRQKADGTFLPNLAEKWTVEPKQITFTLRPNITCSDGSELTAQTVANNIRYMNDPKNHSALMGNFISATATATVDEAARQVTVSVPEASPFMLAGFAMQPIVCQDGMDHPDKYKEKTIGSGPWVLTKASPGVQYEYKVRKDYAWGPTKTSMKSPGVPDKLVVKIIETASTTANLLLSGAVNYAAVSGPDTQRLLAAKLAHIDGSHGTGLTLFNEAPGRPTADRTVREALITGTNIPEILKVATSNEGSNSTGLATIMPKACPNPSLPGIFPAFDADKAKSLLDSAGWKVGANGVRSKDGVPLELSFLYPSTRGVSITAGAELLGKQWTALGVKIHLVPFTVSQLGTYVFETGKWDAGWVAITVGSPDQLTPYFSGIAPPKGNNFTHIDNAEYDQHVKASAQFMGKENCAEWNAAGDALFKNFDVVPMFNTPTRVFLKNAAAEAPDGLEIFPDSLRLYKS